MARDRSAERRPRIHWHARPGVAAACARITGIAAIDLAVRDGRLTTDLTEVTCGGCLRAWSAATGQPTPSRKRDAERRVIAELRTAVFGHYGTACACCGSSENLSIDHINGDGPAQRTAALGYPGGYNSITFYRWIVSHGFPDYLQSLCRECNSSKSDGGACRLDHDDRAGQRQRDNAAAQAAWRARHDTARHVSVKPGTVGGRIMEYLERGPAAPGLIAAELGLTYSTAAVTLSGLLKAGHVERPEWWPGQRRGLYCLPGYMGTNLCKAD